MEQIELNTLHNHIFKMQGCTKDDDISVLSAGYIIRPDGKCVIIPDGKDHIDIYSTYIQKFLETNYLFYQLTKAIQILTKEPFSCIIYNGIRPIDLKQVYRENTNANGYGIFFLPTLELTEEQRRVCQNLLNSNRSLFGGYEKLKLSYGFIDNGEISKEEFEKMIFQKVKKRDKSIL